MYLVFTTPKCGRCNVVKNLLNQKGVQYSEINIVESKENLELAQKYNVSLAGTIIDSKTGKQVVAEEIE